MTAKARRARAACSLALLAALASGCRTQRAAEAAVDKSTGDPVILLKGSIRFYQLFISTQDESSCIFTPTCSHYASEAIGRYGLAGILMAQDRLTRCNPLNAQYSILYARNAGGKLVDPLEAP